ncbi:MAG TPA: DNA methyltransferase [Thermoleophilia bacterium]|nr:DNA methyltransferase [Thermoleophilia bacterium]
MSRQIDLRHGDYRDVLADVECDALIVDAPYGARTHRGNDAASKTRSTDGSHRRPISYMAWSSVHVHDFVNFWAPRTRGWIVSLTSHDLIPAWEEALEAAGRYVFAPLPFVVPGIGVRLVGDGPSSWTVFVVVARPRSKSFAGWGTLPGAYIKAPGGSASHRSPRIGGKDLELMRAIVRDYSRPGDLVCDPCAGGGTTLAAAALEGRRAVGAEVDADAHAAATQRLFGIEPVESSQIGLLT